MYVAMCTIRPRVTPDNGVAPGTAFEDLPEDWVCPECGVEKDQFSEYEG